MYAIKDLTGNRIYCLTFGFILENNDSSAMYARKDLTGKRICNVTYWFMLNNNHSSSAIYYVRRDLLIDRLWVITS